MQHEVHKKHGTVRWPGLSCSRIERSAHIEQVPAKQRQVLRYTNLYHTDKVLD